MDNFLRLCNEDNEELFWESLMVECNRHKLCFRIGDLFVFSDEEDRLIFILLDRFYQEEFADDEEDYYTEPPLYFNCSSHRISPVYFLWGAARYICKSYGKSDVDATRILLTRTIIINADSVCDIWDRLGVRVRGAMTKMPQHLCDNDSICETNMHSKVDEILHEPDLLSAFIEQKRKDKIPGWTDNIPNMLSSHSGSLKSGEEGEAAAEEEEEEGLPFVRIIKAVADPNKELDKLFGLEHVKDYLLSFEYLACYNSLLEELGERPVKKNLNTVFTGRPGTGKKTVAEIYSSTLYKHGFIDKGRTVVVNVEYFTDSLDYPDAKVTAITELGLGGVVVINNADYLLSNEEGKYVITLLLERVRKRENENTPDFVLVLCFTPRGTMIFHQNFPEQAKKLGHFMFNDYDFSELAEIFHMKARELNYSFTDKAWALLAEEIEAIYEQGHKKQSWQNFLELQELWNRILSQHLHRCNRKRITTKPAILRISSFDVKTK